MKTNDGTIHFSIQQVGNNIWRCFNDTSEAFFVGEENKCKQYMKEFYKRESNRKIFNQRMNQYLKFNTLN